MCIRDSATHRPRRGRAPGRRDRAHGRARVGAGPHVGPRTGRQRLLRLRRRLLPAPAVTWTILIPTLGQRSEYLCQLLDGLLPQVAKARGVKVLAYWDNGEVDIAHKKQALLDAADADYVSYVDDDDTVSPDYVSSIVEAMQFRPHMVGLKMQVYKDGRPYALSHHSLSPVSYTHLTLPT